MRGTAIGDVPINATYLQGLQQHQFMKVQGESGQTVDCNTIEDNYVTHSSRWANFVSGNLSVIGTVITYRCMASWKFQIGLKYDNPSVGAGIFYRIYNGTNRAWTGWQTISKADLTPASIQSLIEKEGGVADVSQFSDIQSIMGGG